MNALVLSRRLVWLLSLALVVAVVFIDPARVESRRIASRLVRVPSSSSLLQPVRVNKEDHEEEDADSNKQQHHVSVASFATLEEGASVTAATFTEAELADAFRTIAAPNLDFLRQAIPTFNNNQSPLYAAFRARRLLAAIPLRANYPTTNPPTDVEVAAVMTGMVAAASPVVVAPFSYTLDVHGRVTQVEGTVGVSAGSNPSGGATSFVGVAYRASTGANRPVGNGPNNGQADGDYDAGHIAAASLGGSNSALINFFPQRRDSNSRGAYWQAEQDAAALRVAAVAHNALNVNSVFVRITYDYPADQRLVGLLADTPRWIPTGGNFLIQWVTADIGVAVPPVVGAPVGGRLGWVEHTRVWSNL